MRKRKPPVVGRVWLIVDCKYGPQLVCTDEQTAETELERGDYHLSGEGAAVIPYDLHGDACLMDIGDD